VPPAPEGIVGLRQWTVELPSADEVAAVAGLVRAGGFEAEEREDGLLMRDPWNMALLVTTAGAG